MSAEKIRTEKQREAARVYEQEVLGGGALQRADHSGALQAAAATDPSDPGQLLAMAIQQGADPAALEKLVGLYERLDARRAEREFSAAMLALQSEIPTIAHNRSVFNKAKDGEQPTVRYKFTDLEYLVTMLRPFMSRHGFSYTQDTRLEPTLVTVITMVRHSGGHVQSTTCAAPVDPKGIGSPPLYLSAQQNAASSTSFAQRKGLALAFGLVFGGEDNDAQAPAQFINEDQVQEIVDLIAETNTDPDRFLKWAKVDQIAHIPARDYRRALAMFAEKKRKAGL